MESYRPGGSRPAYPGSAPSTSLPMYDERTLLPKVEGPDNNKICWPRCIYFKCGKIEADGHPALVVRGGGLWCRWLEQPCLGAKCSFAECIRNKLLPQERCALVIRRVTQDVLTPEDFKVDVKLKGRVARKLGQEEDMV